MAAAAATASAPTARGKPPAAAAATAAAPHNGEADQPRYLSITVHEAKGLLAKDYETGSSDPFVKVMLGLHVQKTRVVYKSLNPMWQQRLLFPLSGLDDGEPLLVELLDKDPCGQEFLGQVLMTLGKALQLAGDGEGWLQLSKRRATDTVAGAVRLSFEVLDSAAHLMVLADAAQAADPVGVAARLSPCALRVQLHGLSGLFANGMADPPSSLSQDQQLVGSSKSSSNMIKSSSNVDLARSGGVRGSSRMRATSLLLRYGRLKLEHQLPQRGDAAASTTTLGCFDVPIDKEAIIPLAPALLAGNRLARRMKQLHDVKISIKAGDVTLAKTQIPVWDVPHVLSPAPAVGTTASEEPCDFVEESRLWLTKNGEPAAGGSSCNTPRCETPRACDPADRGGSFRIVACRSDGSILGGRGLSFMRSSSPTDLTKRLRSVLSVEATAASQTEWLPLRSPSPAAAATPQGLTSLTAGGDFCKEQVSGKLYHRVMEPRVPVTGANPVEVSVSLSLESLPTMQERAGGATVLDVRAGQQICEDAKVDEDDGEADDKPDLSIPPAALATSLVDVDVEMDVETLFATLFGNSSGFMTKHWSTEGLRNFEATPWTQADNQGLASRNLAYVKPLRIPIPLAPKQCNVWEKQSILSKSDDGFVVLCQSSNDAPKGDCFNVLVQLYGVRQSSGRSRLRITMEMVFNKSCLGRGMIQQGAEADARRGWRALVDSLRQTKESVSVREPSLSSSSVGTAAYSAAAHIEQQPAQQQLHHYKPWYRTNFVINPALLFASSMQLDRVVSLGQLLILFGILASVCHFGFSIERKLSMLEHLCHV